MIGRMFHPEDGKKRPESESVVEVKGLHVVPAIVLLLEEYMKDAESCLDVPQGSPKGSSELLPIERWEFGNMPLVKVNHQRAVDLSPGTCPACRAL